MIADNFGLLHLPSVPPEIREAALRWRDLPENKIILFLSLILLLATFSELTRLLPQLITCLWKHRENITLEHSLSSSQSRNILFLAIIFPTAAILNRFFSWGYLQLAASLVFCLLLRIVLYRILMKKLRSEENRAARRTILNASIILGLTIVASVSALMIFKTPDKAIRTIITVETGLFYLVSIIRTGEIFAKFCSGFSTFLYLCALEFAPVAATAALAILLF